MFLLNAFSFLLGIIVLSEISGDVADDFRQLTAQLPGEHTGLQQSILTYSYLTPLVKWILASGTDILDEPSPYKTRSSPDNPPLLASFRDVLAALTKGMKIRYTAFLDSCMTATKSGTSDLPHELGGSVGSFEYFNESRFGPEEFFGFTSSGIKVNETGLVRELTEVLVFGSGTVSINITVLSPDFSREIRKITFACHLGANARQSQSFFFYTDGVTPTPLLTFQDLQKSLESGHEVRSVSKYYNCQGIQANAIGGGPIEDFHVHDDKILNSQSTLITNYQGAGYVYDVVSATYWSNGSVIFTASDVDVVTYKPYYSEQIICHFGGDSMYFYRF